MSRSLPAALSEDLGLVDDDCISDSESFNNVKPIVDRKIELETRIGLQLRNAYLNSLVRSDGIIRLKESDEVHEMMKNKFTSQMGNLGVNVQVEHVDIKNYKLNAATSVQLQTFLTNMKSENEGDAKTKFAWFGGSKDQINKIILHGFGQDDIEKDNGFGYGLHLCTQSSLLESVESSIADDEGVKHMLLCRVIIGKREAVESGSKQCLPSSGEFLTGVDSLESPKKIIVWSPYMNTHVLLACVIRFKILQSFSIGPAIARIQLDRVPRSPRMPNQELVYRLSNILPPEATRKIRTFHHKYIEHKISRREMLEEIRKVAGDRLLLKTLKDFKEEEERKQAQSEGSEGGLTMV